MSLTLEEMGALSPHPAVRPNTDMSRIALGLAVSLLSALLLIVSWQAFGDQWWLIFIAFVPMYVAQYRIFSRRWSAVAVGIATAGYYLALLLQAPP